MRLTGAQVDALTPSGVVSGWEYNYTRCGHGQPVPIKPSLRRVGWR